MLPQAQSVLVPNLNLPLIYRAGSYDTSTIITEDYCY